MPEFTTPLPEDKLAGDTGHVELHERLKANVEELRDAGLISQDEADARYTTPTDVDDTVDTAVATAAALLVPLTQKGAASGVATLDSGTLVPVAQLPVDAITDEVVEAVDGLYVPVAQAAVLADTGEETLTQDGTTSGQAADAGHSHRFPNIVGTGSTGTITVYTEDGTPVTFNVVAGVVGSATPSGDPPDAPTGLTATPGDTEVDLSWTAPANPGDGTISDYVVQFDDGGGWSTFTDGVSTGTTATVTGLTNNVSHDFRVAAVSEHGTGAWSTTDTATPTVAGGFVELWDRADGAIGNGWTQANGTYSLTILGNKGYNAAGTGGQFAGCVRDLDTDVAEAVLGEWSVVAVGPVGAPTGDPANTAMYIAGATTATNDNVIYWYNVGGGTSVISSVVSGTPADQATGLPEIEVGMILTVEHDGGGHFIPKVDGVAVSGKDFTVAGAAAWTVRGAFADALNQIGTITWVPA